ncbi:MAG: WD40 repeat domain-containing protein [Anaerolineales bacterium]
MDQSRLISAVLLIIILFAAACGPSVTEVPKATQIPPSLIPQAEPVVISTQVNTPAPVLTGTVSPYIPFNLEVINYVTIMNIEGIVAIPVLDVIELEFSPNEQYLRMRDALGPGNYKDIYVDLNSGLETLTLEGSQRVYFNPNSTSITALIDNRLVEYDLKTGEEEAVYTSDYDIAALSPDRKWLVVIEEIDVNGPGTTFIIVDLDTKEEIHRIFVNTVMDKYGFQFGPAGDLLAGSYIVPPETHITTFWSLVTGKAVHTLYGFSEIVFDPFNPEVAASNAKQNYISLINIHSWEQRLYLGDANDGPVYFNMGYTNYSGMLYALIDGIDTYPWFWKPRSGERVWWPVHFGDLSDITISPGSKLMATSQKNSIVNILGIVSSQEQE